MYPDYGTGKHKKKINRLRGKTKGTDVTKVTEVTEVYHFCHFCPFCHFSSVTSVPSVPSSCILTRCSRFKKPRYTAEPDRSEPRTA